MHVDCGNVVSPPSAFISENPKSTRNTAAHTAASNALMASLFRCVSRSDSAPFPPLVTDPTSLRIGPGHTRQAQRFVTAAVLALRTVTDLCITIMESDDELDIRDLDMLSALRPFPHACPLLQQLRVTGAVGAPLLSTFGATCKHLTKLSTEDIGPSTAERLHELLPQVTSTYMMLATEEDYHSGYPEDYLLAVSTCRTLHSLDIGLHPMTPDLWRVLPSCLKKLHTGGAYDPDTGSVGESLSLSACPPLPNLTFACLYADGLPLSLLANLLRAAPKLTSIFMGGVWVPSSVDQIPDLLLLNQRLSEGLKIHNTVNHSLYEEGLVLQLRDLAVPPFEEPVTSSFLSSLPVLEHFVNLVVETAGQPQLAGLAKAFPQLSMLSISSVVEAGSFPSLAAVFPTLQHLRCISNGNTFTGLEVGVLCMQLPSLKVLDVRAKGMDRKALKRVLRTWGRMMKVNVYPERSDDDA